MACILLLNIFVLLRPISSVRDIRNSTKFSGKNNKIIDVNNVSKIEIFEKDSIHFKWVYRIPKKYVVKYDLLLVSGESAQKIATKMGNDHSFLAKTDNFTGFVINDMLLDELEIANVTTLFNHYKICLNITAIDEDSNLLFVIQELYELRILREPKIFCSQLEYLDIGVYSVDCKTVSYPDHSFFYEIDPEVKWHYRLDKKSFDQGTYVTETRITLSMNMSEKGDHTINVRATCEYGSGKNLTDSKNIKLKNSVANYKANKGRIVTYSLAFSSCSFVFCLIFVIAIIIKRKRRRRLVTKRTREKHEKNEDNLSQAYQTV